MNKKIDENFENSKAKMNGFELETKIKKIISKQKKFFGSGESKKVDFRIKQLKKLKKVIKENEENIVKALKIDFAKSEFETYGTEIGFILEEITYMTRRLKRWARPKKVKTPLTLFPSSSYIYQDPYGIALIIAPWNYPVQLVMAPLLGAVAAGNCTVIKPSEFVPATSAVIAKIIKETFDEKFVAVIEGDVEANKLLLDEKFDIIFFTGSIPVGKIVMEAASKHLTPVVLELGGKSPCIIDKNVDIDKSAKRIAWGKFLNAGQTCVAPDYLMVHEDIKEKFIKSFKEQIKNFYGENPQNSPDYPRIISERHFNRLASFLDDGKIVEGGVTDRDELYIAPTVIEEINWENDVMQDEIFGPILPVLTYSDFDEVIETVNTHSKPLALYIFSTDSKIQDRILNETSFGGGCVNDVIKHLGTPNLPFGGVGDSGMGSYHGKSSFDTFSHSKSILKNNFTMDIPVIYPPYKGKLRILKKLLK